MAGNIPDDPSNLDFTMQVRKKLVSVVRDPYFRDCDFDLIFDLLKERMRIVPFGDHLKRYIYIKAGMDGNYQDIPVSCYQDIICSEFADRHTPCTFTPTTIRIRNAARNWLEQQTVSRNVVLLLGFGLGMSEEDVSQFLSKALQEPELNAKDPFEAICLYCYRRELGFLAFEDLWERYLQVSGQKTEEPDLDSTARFKEKLSEVHNETELFSYLAGLPLAHGTKRQSITSRQQFDRLYLEAKSLIARILTEAEKDSAEMNAGRLEERLSHDDRLFDYQKLQRIRNEKGNYTTFSPADITPADVENVIFSAVPKDENGNLASMKDCRLDSLFSGKRLTRQRLGEILSGKAPITRFDLLTLHFFVFSQNSQGPKKQRYAGFIDSSNQLLRECNFGPLYVVNPYECFLAICMLADDPLGTYADVWELSYENLV